MKHIYVLVCYDVMFSDEENEEDELDWDDLLHEILILWRFLNVDISQNTV